MNKNNYKAVECLWDPGYPLPNIHKALHALAAWTQSDIVRRPL